jgi:hypothetical protein
LGIEPATFRQSAGITYLYARITKLRNNAV